MSANILLLMDGAAMAYRAFYAIQNLSTNAGQPTNALFGFIRMANQLATQWCPTHRAVVFDAGLPAARMSLLPSYKQQREKMPDPLRSQFPLIEEFLRSAGIPALRVEGEEADDTMASLAMHASADAVDTLLATSDKDLFQIVTDHVAIVAPTASGGRMGPAEVCAKMGVPPGQIVELLALTGDTVDNIPGVPGVGPKTAAKLLAEFGSLEGLWARLDAVAGEKTRAALAAHRSDVERNVKLIRLRTDLVKRVDWDALRVQPVDVPTLRAFYQAMELHSLARELDAPPAVPPAKPPKPTPPESSHQLDLF
jgi:DNA polymerase I